MKILYLGTAAAEGVPAEFCNCETCKKARLLGGKNIRTRSQLIIDGVLGVDYPPEAFYHSVAFGVDLSAIENLLITHSHMDHFYAHDFILRGYKYGLNPTSETLSIFGNEEVEKVFFECTRREMRADVKEGISVQTVKCFTPFRIGGYTVTAFPAVHSKEEQALLYLVEKAGKGYLHLCDTGSVTEETFNYLKENKKTVDLVTLDCTLVDTTSSKSGRHMDLVNCQKVVLRLKADGVANEKTKFVITHFSHNSAPFQDRLESLVKEQGWLVAFDGMEVNI